MVSRKSTKTKKPKRKSVKVKSNPNPILSQFLGIHNQSLNNSIRDNKVRESIMVRLKEDNTLSESLIADLHKRRKELL